MDISKIKPMKGNAIVRHDNMKEQTEGGIFIPNEAQKKTHTGTVLALPDGVADIAPGDSVLYKKFAGEPLAGQEENIVRIKIEEIIAKVGV